MSLESIVEAMHTTFNERFVTREVRAQRLATISENLRDIKRLDGEDLQGLDRIWVRLASDNHSTLYKQSIKELERLRRPYRPHNNNIAYHIVNAKGVRYEKRFEELEQRLASDDCSYDETALALASLQNNRYLKRRARHDKQFSEKLDRIQSMLGDKIHEQAGRYAPSHGLKQRLVRGAHHLSSVAAAGAILAACMPTTLYASLLG